MGPKKNVQTEEVDDIKKSLDFLTDEMSTVKTQQSRLLELLEEVKQLCLQNLEKDKRIAELERRVDDLEQYSRRNDVLVLITGISIKPRSYARAVAVDSGDEPGEREVRSVEQQVAAFLQSKGVELDLDCIEACHPLPRRINNDRPAVILRFVNRRNKKALLKQGRKLKGTNVYINEHLTKKNADIARKARYLRKQEKIQHTWVTNGKIFIKLNGSPEEAKILIVKNMEELDKYQ